ncbi:MAG: SIR2 family protein, partial [Candidatus Hodarchaeota archaeon]
MSSRKINISTKNPLSLAKALHPLLSTGFIAFCGAGVSISPPSCSPSWWTLTEEIIQILFQEAPPEWGVPTDLIIRDSQRQPEEVLENFLNLLEERLYKALDFLKRTQSNATHVALAKLAKVGILKACFTTNFDIFFEAALKAEGVDYDLLVDNRQYDNYFQQYLKGQSKTPNKFILCKIHGTIERPDTIVSVASAYKTAKGFSLPKAAVFSSLISTYPCLFLGYSGWDFDHQNYRRFWERIGSRVQKIVWNRLPNESGSPDFSDIFRSCFDRFEFCEGVLPKDLMVALENQLGSKISLRKVRLIPEARAERIYEQAKFRRTNFLKTWVRGLSDVHKLGLVITESRNFTQRFREFMQASKEQVEGTEAISFGYTEKFQELAEKYSRQEITPEEYQKQTMQLQLELQLKHIKVSHRALVLDTIQQNRYPGITDNSGNVASYLSMVASLSKWFDPEETISLALEYLQ